MIKIGWITGVLALLFLFIASPVQVKAFTVVIDPGHGGKDPGAVTSQGYEKAINLAVALKLGELITANHKDVKVIYTRKTDVFIELYERAAIANRNKADLFISIHTNSVKNRSKVQGAETYTLGLDKTEENLEVAMRENSVIMLEDNYRQRYGGFDPTSTESYIIFEFMQNRNMEQSVALASDIQKSFAAAKRIDRGVRQAGLWVLRETGMPGVLVELGFISNKQEEQYMRSTAGQNQLAKAIYSAFKTYYQRHNVTAAKTSSTVSPTSPISPASPISSTSPTSPTSPPPEGSPASSSQGAIIYKVQILSSDKQLPANSPRLKGHKADWYQDGNLYKYTVGESTDLQTIQNLQKKVSKDFKDAFIIRMKDGKRLN